ncbi:MAG: hypothetical protein J1F12_09255, partial [Muribaculaceae bacterium]|nr:hypothetical protein [Muribaculaceae bacterium]
ITSLKTGFAATFWVTTVPTPPAPIIRALHIVGNVFLNSSSQKYLFILVKQKILLHLHRRKDKKH